MNSNHFQNGTAVVTGAGSGLGAAMVDRFVGQAMSIVALDIDGERAGQKAAVVRDGGGQAQAMRVDVADRNSLEAAARLTDEAFGGCTVLCANVGVQQFGAIERLTEQDWRWVLDVNVMGVVNTVNAFMPLLRKRSGNRHILLTSSSSALDPGVRLGAYIASKFAVMGYGEVLRQELASENIGVSILFPAGMITRHLESSVLARPAALGKSVRLPDDIEVMKASRKMDNKTHVVTAEQATRNLLKDLAANERYIITHGQYRDGIEERFEGLLRAHDRAQSG